eukprot:2937105-Prymnesium_polylepis.1
MLHASHGVFIFIHVVVCDLCYALDASQRPEFRSVRNGCMFVLAGAFSSSHHLCRACACVPRSSDHITANHGRRPSVLWAGSVNAFEEGNSAFV